MVWIFGAILMFLFGAGLVVIGVYLASFSRCDSWGIMVLVGIFLLVSIRRSGGPLARACGG